MFESHEEVKPSMHRAKLIDAEWRNGIRALQGEDMTGITRCFPDKDGVFHWDGGAYKASSRAQCKKWT